jgi:hypothetical protein
LTPGGSIGRCGADALPQGIKTGLSHQEGECPFRRDFGNRFAEYYQFLAGSPWFEEFLKLEVIGQAAIPHVAQRSWVRAASMRRAGTRSPGHSFDGGSLVEILVAHVAQTGGFAGGLSK